MESTQKVKVLVACVANAIAEAVLKEVDPVLSSDQYDFVRSQDQYDILQDKYDYEVLVVLSGGPFMTFLLNDQANNNKKLKWVHSLSAGIDAYVKSEDFVNSNIPLTNAKGAFSAALAEYIALGMLYFAKNVPHFLKSQRQNTWCQKNVALVSDKTMLIVGYGDIGAACGKVGKALSSKVIGLKRRPTDVTLEQQLNADQILGIESLEEFLPIADYVVGILPLTLNTKHFFNSQVFAKMKAGSVFMNIGRGPTCKESDLVDALKAGQIAGALLDVFEEEPLPKVSELWQLENVLITPHCADQDADYLTKAVNTFAQNLQKFKAKEPLINLCDKKQGY